MKDKSNAEELGNQEKNLPENLVPKITIICSAPDLASQNIKTHLLKLREWKSLELPENSGFLAARKSIGRKIQACRN